MSILKFFASYKQFLIFLFVIILAFSVRFYNFTDRINFGPEQAISLIVAGDNLKEKFSLLGDENIQRATSNGLIIFHAPVFNYSLIPLQMLFNYNPITITAFFSLLNILTGIVLFFVAKHIFNFMVAVFAFILFLFNSYMIDHSLFIWGQNYIPLINIVIGLFLYEIAKKKPNIENKNIFFIGLLSGLSIGLQFFYLFTSAILFILTTYFSKKKLLSVVFFIAGTILSLMPIILFDLKHEFYFIKTLYQYFLDTIQLPQQSKINYYHFLQFWPILAVLFGWLLNLLYQRLKIAAIVVIFAYIIWNLSPLNISFTEAKGMSKGLNFTGFEKAAVLISNDKPSNFNVSALLDFDSRAYPLRYLLKFKYGVIPKGIEEYTNLDSLYVLAKTDYNFDKAIAYEINAYKPFKVELLEKINNDYAVFKLKH